MNTIQELKELGFEVASNKVEQSQEFVRKSAIAYEHFDFISAEDVKKFQEILKKNTLKEDKHYNTYDTLKFHNIKDYPEVPPLEVLNKLREAKEKNCFDYFEIAKIESVREVKDPILFGKVNECGDYFFIAQWDDDITLEAIRETIKK